MHLCFNKLIINYIFTGLSDCTCKVLRSKMTTYCNKRNISLIWVVLECLFFTGIVFGWSWLTVALKKDRYFLDLCNVTFPNHEINLGSYVNPDPLSETEIEIKPIPNTKRKCRVRKKFQNTTPNPEINLEQFYRYPFNESYYFCDAQEERLELINAIIVIVRNIFVLPIGILFDVYGTTRTRLIAV